MKRSSSLLLGCLCAAVADALPAVPATAGSGLEIRWATLDAGQAVLSAGGLRLSATVGQADVPVGAPMTGGSLQLRAGYWLSPGESDDRIFANGFDLSN